MSRRVFTDRTRTVAGSLARGRRGRSRSFGFDLPTLIEVAAYGSRAAPRRRLSASQRTLRGRPARWLPPCFRPSAPPQRLGAPSAGRRELNPNALDATRHAADTVAVFLCDNGMSVPFAKATVYPRR